MTDLQPPAAQHQPADTVSYAPPPSAKSTNGLGIAALIIGIVALVLSLIPLVGAFGGFLAFVGLVLGVVGLFLKNKKKGTAIAGSVVSGIALVLSIVMGLVYTAMFVSSVDESLNQPVAVSPGEETPGEAPAAQEPAAAEAGTRANPVAIGSVISGSEYDVTINSVALNATEQVVAANTFSEAPPEGFAYAVVNATITYTGAESGFASFASIDYVADSGEVYSQSDNFVVAPDPSFGLDELFTGGTVTGNLVVAIPNDAQGVLRVQPGMLSDEVFVALQ